MKNNIAVKLFFLFALIGLSMIPLGVIWTVVSERARHRDRVAAEVGQSSARAQVLLGPMLVVNAAREASAAIPAVPQANAARGRELVLLPDSLVLHSDVQVETRQRGIHRVPVYRATNRITATFSLPARPETGAADPVLPGSARVVFGITDARGLRVIPIVKTGGRPLTVHPQTDLDWVPHGFSAPVELTGSSGTFALEAEVVLTGTDRLTLVPLGADTRATMESNWPHPGFVGGFSPDERRISRRGFQAAWQLSRFATGIPAAMMNRQANTPYEGLAVRFVQPVDIYQQSERAVKYGVLFVALTFVAFFLFETLRRLSIHPIQYGLVAAALAIFFLLLVSLSEHLPFATAYVVASGACVGLLVFYAGHVLGSLPRAFGFGALLVALYILLYVILLSEDYALLLGSLLLFTALSVVVVATRRVDWYRLGEERPPAR